MGRPSMGRHFLSLTLRIFWAKYPFGVPTSVGGVCVPSQTKSPTQLEVALETDFPAQTNKVENR